MEGILVPDTETFLKLIKQAAVEAVRQTKPCNLMFGTVKNEKPLLIHVDGDSKMELEKAFLILSRNVTDYEVEMTVEHKTELQGGGSGDAAFESHLHEYKGRKKFLVHKALKMGERVILVQLAGESRYIVLDRIGEG